MTNHLAIATVTATLKRILQKEIEADVPGVTITAQSPGTVNLNPQNMLNLFLYQVWPNSGYSNLDLPARSSNGGELSSKPFLGLNLYYLLTAYASGNNDLIAHRIIASAIRTLHEEPILTRESIRNTVLPSSDVDGSDLEFQLELVKISHKPLSLEELTKLWSSFFQTQYHISVAYETTVVLIDGKNMPRTTLPVLKRNIHLVQIKQPAIERVKPSIVELSDDAKITIIGTNLEFDNIEVKFDNLSPNDTPKPSIVTDNTIIIGVPEGLSSGIKRVQVMHKIKVDTDDENTYRIFRSSNVVPFVLAPKIIEIPSSVNQGSILSISVKPAIIPHQKVEFLIGDKTLSATIDETTDNVSVNIPNNFLEGGNQHRQFLFRVRVDGAESFLKIEDNEFTGPIIEVRP